jgi:hypothetical protein
MMKKQLEDLRADRKLMEERIAKQDEQFKQRHLISKEETINMLKSSMLGKSKFNSS